MSKYSLHVLVRNDNFKLVKLWMEFTNKLLFSFTCWVSNQNIVWGKMSHNHDNGCRLEPSSTTTSTEVETTNEKSKIKKKRREKVCPLSLTRRKKKTWTKVVQFLLAAYNTSQNISKTESDNLNNKQVCFILISLLQKVTVTWHKIRHAAGQARSCFRTQNKAKSSC